MSKISPERIRGRYPMLAGWGPSKLTRYHPASWRPDTIVATSSHGTLTTTNVAVNNVCPEDHGELEKGDFTL